MAVLSVLLWCAVTVLVLVRFYLNNVRRPPNYPPGPPRIPFLEDYALLLLINARHLHRAAVKLARFYRTNVLGLSLVGSPTIVVQDLALAKEVLNRGEFDGRPNLFMAQMRHEQFKRRGLFFTEGPGWKDHRWFFLRHLRDYGFGRRSEQYEQEVESELSQLVHLLEFGQRYDYEQGFVRNDGVVKCPDVFFVTLGNMLLQLLIGERFHRGRAKSLVNTARNSLLFLRNADAYGTVYSYFPWLRFVFPFTIKYNKIRGGMLGVNRFIETLIAKQRQTFDADKPRNFIDLYLREMQSHVPQSEDFTFQHDQLVSSLADLYLPSVAGTAIQLSMLIERLLLNPEVLRKVRQEIDEVVGQERLPTLDDRTDLPYTEATLRESLRIDSLIPSGIVHRTKNDTTLGEYTVRENTLVFIDLARINSHPDVWEEPDAFRPERFLDDDGKLALSKDHSLTFGAGKRVCVGQTYTRNAMFLILATLMQRFELRQRASDRLPDVSKRQTGLIHGPGDFWVQFVPRQVRN